MQRVDKGEDDHGGCVRQYGIPCFTMPRYTSRKEIPSDLLSNGGSTQGSIAQKLEKAMIQSGYDRAPSYFWTRGGFAIATPLEHVDPDGHPLKGNARWSVRPGLDRGFSLSTYLKALFLGDPGHYRVIVFVVSDVPIVPASKPPSQQEVQDWETTGGDRLPSKLAELPYTTAHKTVALIYEFERRTRSEQASLKINSEVGPETHLDLSGILRSLSGS